MFKEILKIIPKLDDGELANTERKLSSRFARVAKKFGGGLKAAIMGGGVLALAAGVIDKILNPLKETQESMDRILNQADDLSTFAKQFGTSTGQLFKLQTLAQAKGLGPEEIRVLLNKFQTAVLEAKADPSKESPVKNFMGDKDTAESFFNFIQSLQKLTKDQQDFVQRQVFGEKQILKASEFLNTTPQEFEKLAKDMGLRGSQTYSYKIDPAAQVSDVNQMLTAKREADSFFNNLALMSEDKVKQRDQQERNRLSEETSRLKAYDSLEKMQIQMDLISQNIEKGFLELVKYTPRLIDGITAIAKSRTIRAPGPKKGE